MVDRASPSTCGVLDLVLAEYSPIVGLEFEQVAEQNRADIKAYMGLPSSSASDLGLQACADFGGCAIPSTNQSTGVASAATIVAWHFDWIPEPEQFIKAIAHEVLHAIVTVGHRPTPDALMGEPVSPGDLEMIRLNSHALVRPGMNMAQVRELIVLSDELLDPPEPGVYESLWRTAEGFQRAGSARFELTGDWIGNCGFPAFGPADYRVTGYSHAHSQFAHFGAGDLDIWNSQLGLLGRFGWHLDFDFERGYSKQHRLGPCVNRSDASAPCCSGMGRPRHLSDFRA